jgi:hypothetical protein
MLYEEIIAVCYQIHIQHKIVLCEKNVCCIIELVGM